MPGFFLTKAFPPHNLFLKKIYLSSYRILMKLFQKYLSLFLLCVLIFPVADKTCHELKHLSETHCTGKGLHYCAQENTCQICDYVFSNAHVPLSNIGKINYLPPVIDLQYKSDSKKITAAKTFFFSLRGPPTPSHA